MATMPKKTRGRQKIELKRVKNEDARYVTFSKRKLSLFKTATELGTLCGAEIAPVMFSPAGQPKCSTASSRVDLPKWDPRWPAIAWKSAPPSSAPRQPKTWNERRAGRPFLRRGCRCGCHPGGKASSMDSTWTSSWCRLKRWRRSSPRLFPGSVRSFSKGHHRR